MNNFNKIFPDWTLKIEETSNNVYQFTSSNNEGNKVEFADSDYDSGVKRIFGETFDMEITDLQEGKYSTL